MKSLRTSSLSLACALVLGFGAPAYAGFTITLTETGGNVVATGVGTLLTGGLTSGITLEGVPAMVPAGSFMEIGADSLAHFYSGAIIGPSSFGPGTGANAAFGIGDFAGIDIADGPLLWVPQNYTSGSPLASSATWTGQTFSSLGVTPGTYTWTWGSGPTADFLTLNAVAVPEPATNAMLALGIVVLAAPAVRYQRSRKKKAV